MREIAQAKEGLTELQPTVKYVLEGPEKEDTVLMDRRNQETKMQQVGQL